MKTNNKQQTAVEWLFSETLGITLQLANKRISHRNWELQMVKLYEQAKEMEKEQSHLYAAFCIKCIHEKMPIIKFEDWTKLGGGNK
jgi:hypothetical protein